MSEQFVNLEISLWNGEILHSFLWAQAFLDSDGQSSYRLINCGGLNYASQLNEQRYAATYFHTILTGKTRHHVVLDVLHGDIKPPEVIHASIKRWKNVLGIKESLYSVWRTQLNNAHCNLGIVPKPNKHLIVITLSPTLFRIRKFVPTIDLEYLLNIANIYHGFDGSNVAILSPSFVARF